MSRQFLAGRALVLWGVPGILALLVIVGSDAMPAAQPPGKDKTSPFEGPGKTSSKPAAAASPKSIASTHAEANLASGEEAIENALASRTRVDFQDTPLKDVIQFFQQQQRVNVVLDQCALDMLVSTLTRRSR